MHEGKFSIENDRLIKHFEKAHEGLVSCLAVSKNSQFMLSGSFDRHIKKWDLTNGVLLNDFGVTHSTIIHC